MNKERKLKRADANLSKSISNNSFDKLMYYAYKKGLLSDLGKTYWNNAQAIGKGVRRVRDLVSAYNNEEENKNDKLILSGGQYKDLTDAFRKYSGVYGDLKEWYENQQSSNASTGTASQPSSSTSTGTASQPSSSTSTGTNSTGTKAFNVKNYLNNFDDKLYNDLISDESAKILDENIRRTNENINAEKKYEDKQISDYVNRLLNKNTLPEVKKITPGMDNLLALDRKGRRSLRRGEYTRLNNGTAVQAKTRKEGRQLSRAINRQRRANNRADKRQGTLDSFLAGYARKGGKLTLMDIYMNNK